MRHLTADEGLAGPSAPAERSREERHRAVRKLSAEPQLEPRPSGGQTGRRRRVRFAPSGRYGGSSRSAGSTVIVCAASKERHGASRAPTAPRLLSWDITYMKGAAVRGARLLPVPFIDVWRRIVAAAVHELQSTELAASVALCRLIQHRAPPLCHRPGDAERSPSRPRHRHPRPTPTGVSGSSAA